jgi:hypothetical protein
MYFFAMALVPDIAPLPPQVTRVRATGPSGARAGSAVSSAVAPSQKTGKPTPDKKPNAFERGMDRFEHDPGAANRSIKDALPTLIFVLVPWFAYAVGSVYKRYRRRFPQHVVFALHTHAFMYLVSVPLTLLGFAGSNTLNQTCAVLMVFATGIWTWVGLRRVYGSTVGETTVKFVRVSLIYGVGLFVATLVLIPILFLRLGRV